MSHCALYSYNILPHHCYWVLTLSRNIYLKDVNKNLRNKYKLACLSAKSTPVGGFDSKDTWNIRYCQNYREIFLTLTAWSGAKTKAFDIYLQRKGNVFKYLESMLQCCSSIVHWKYIPNMTQWDDNWWHWWRSFMELFFTSRHFLTSNFYGNYLFLSLMKLIFKIW